MVFTHSDKNYEIYILLLRSSTYTSVICDSCRTCQIVLLILCNNDLSLEYIFKSKDYHGCYFVVVLVGVLKGLSEYDNVYSGPMLDNSISIILLLLTF